MRKPSQSGALARRLVPLRGSIGPAALLLGGKFSGMVVALRADGKANTNSGTMAGSPSTNTLDHLKAVARLLGLVKTGTGVPCPYNLQNRGATGRLLESWRSGGGGLAFYVVRVPGEVTLEAVFEVAGGFEFVVLAGVDD